jgi:predicted extracellular nuclease
MKYNLVAAAALMVAGVHGIARAEMRITEWAYGAGSGEYIELTNLGAGPVDLSGWSFDDDSRSPGSFSLSGLGVVAAGESVIITESEAAVFRTSWSLAPTIKVLGENSNNLGRNDEINIYDNTNALADRLTFGDQNFPGTIRTQNVSGNPLTLAALGANAPDQWQLAFVGDAFGTYASSFGDLGNPGIGSYVVPEPSTVALLAIGFFAMCVSRMRKRTICC